MRNRRSASLNPLPARLLYLGFRPGEQGSVSAAVAPYGYVGVGSSLVEAIDRKGLPVFDGAVVDARFRPRQMLKTFDAVRGLHPQAAIVVIANMADTFVYRQLRTDRRALVLYAPLSVPHLQEALDRLTSNEHRRSA